MRMAIAWPGAAMVLAAALLTGCAALPQRAATKWKDWRYPIRLHLAFTQTSEPFVYKRNYARFYDGRSIEAGWPMGSFERRFYAGYFEITADHRLRATTLLSPAWKVIEAETKRIERAGEIVLGDQKENLLATAQHIHIPHLPPPCYRGPRVLPETVKRGHRLFVIAFLKRLCMRYGLQAIKIVEHADLRRGRWIHQEEKPSPTGRRATTSRRPHDALKKLTFVYPVRIHLRFLRSYAPESAQTMYRYYHKGRKRWPIDAYRHKFGAGFIEISKDHRVKVVATRSPARAALRWVAEGIKLSGEVQRCLEGTHIFFPNQKKLPPAPKPRVPCTAKRGNPLFAAVLIELLWSDYALYPERIEENVRRSPARPGQPR